MFLRHCIKYANAALRVQARCQVTNSVSALLAVIKTFITILEDEFEESLNQRLDPSEASFE